VSQDWKLLKITEREKFLLDEMADLDDWKERYSYILDLATELEVFPEEFRLDEFKVKGCVSQLWLVGQKNLETNEEKTNEERIQFYADSDSLFVKGMAALLVKLFKDLPAKEIAAYEGNILMISGLIQNLSPNRVNGAGSMLARFKEYGRMFG
jgi:cysteine desulfuration protein SufE